MRFPAFRQATLCLLFASATACSDPAGLAPPPQAAPRVIAVAAAFDQTCALTTTSEVWCWGIGVYGEAADTTVHRKAMPEPLVSLHASSGYFGGQFCGQTAAGTVYCWGSLIETDVGYQYADGATLVRMGDFLPGVLATGSGHACALAADSTAHCWGSYISAKRGVPGPYPQNNNGLAAFTDLTVNAVRGGEKFIALAAGSEHTCGIRLDRTLACWGDSSATGTPTVAFTHAQETCWLALACSPSPLLVQSLSGVYAVAAGAGQTCAIASNGLFCWGNNGSLQSGSPVASAGSLPIQIALPETPVAVTAGASHSCALTAAGSAWCWGNNYYGQLGDGLSGAPRGPSRVRFGGQFESLSAGGDFTCGVSTRGAVYCWGAVQGPDGWQPQPEVRRITIPRP